MEEQIVSYTTAIIAKQKGFSNWGRGMVYAINGAIAPFPYAVSPNGRPNKLLENDILYAPTQSLLQKWLISKGIHIELLLDMYSSQKLKGTEEDIIDDEMLCYTAFVYQVGKPIPKPWDDLGHGDYDTMLGVSLKEALYMLPNKEG